MLNHAFWLTHRAIKPLLRPIKTQCLRHRKKCDCLLMIAPFFVVILKLWWLTLQAIFIKTKYFCCLCFPTFRFCFVWKSSEQKKERMSLMRILSMGDKISKSMSDLFSFVLGFESKPKAKKEIDIVSSENNIWKCYLFVSSHLPRRQHSFFL